MQQKALASISSCLLLLLGFTSWAWWGERSVHQAARIELVKARARLSAQVPPAPAASLPARTEPCVDPTLDLQDGADRLREQLAAAEGERDQLRAGLEQAVAELNRLTGKHQADLAAVNAAVAAAPVRRYRGRVVPLLDPELAPLGDRVMVSGKVYNMSGEDAEVTCVLELLQDGRRIDSARFQMRVSAGATQPYQQTFRFPTGGQAATYSARLVIE